MSANFAIGFLYGAVAMILVGLACGATFYTSTQIPAILAIISGLICGVSVHYANK